MTTIMRSIHKFEHKFDRRAESFTFHHPYCAFVAMFIGMPIFILMAVAVATVLLAFPMAWMFGWA